MLHTDLPDDDAPPPANARTLRQFAALTVAVFGTLLALNLYRHDGRPTPAGWIAGALVIGLGLPALVVPGWIKPAYRLSMAVSRPIGHVVSLLPMGLIYFGLMTPLAWAFRLLGRDALALRRRPEAASYWVDRAPAIDPRLSLRTYQNTTPPTPKA